MVTKDDMQLELMMMQVERKEFGRFLLVGTGESETFWNSEKGKQIIQGWIPNKKIGLLDKVKLAFKEVKSNGKRTV